MRPVAAPVHFIVQFLQNFFQVFSIGLPHHAVDARCRVPFKGLSHRSTRGSSIQAGTLWDDVAFAAAERERHLGLRPVSRLYLARGSPCERFMSALAGRPRITRGWDGWLDLPRGGPHLLFSPSLPGARRLGSRTASAAMLGIATGLPQIS
jgi:hypothetical protein